MKIALLGLFGLGLAGTWGGLMLPAMSGWGYAGHGGWQNQPSFFYFGSTDTYRNPSVRGAGSRAAGAGGK